MLTSNPTTFSTSSTTKSGVKPRFDYIFSAVILTLCIILWSLPSRFDREHPNQDNVSATVIEVDNLSLRRMGVLLTGTQRLLVEVTSGEFEQQQIWVNNILKGQLTFDQLYVEGHQIMLTLQISRVEHKINRAVPYSLHRSGVELLLFSVFALFLIGFSRWTGAKALLSFVFTALSIWKLLIPAFLNGYNPILVSLMITACCTAVILCLIAGFTRKAAVALAGACAGLILTTLLAITFGYLFQVPGTVKDFAEMILYAGFLNLNMDQIFISGIFISAAGAVMDVAMDISASQEEMIRENPHLTCAELIASGFRVAHSVIGTMTTTLLFAYSGNFTFIMMMFMARGVDPELIFNTSFVAGELLQTLVGSFGLVLVAPLTAMIGGALYTYKQPVMQQSRIPIANNTMLNRS